MRYSKLFRVGFCSTRPCAGEPQKPEPNFKPFSQMGCVWRGLGSCGVFLDVCNLSIRLMQECSSAALASRVWGWKRSIKRERASYGKLRNVALQNMPQLSAANDTHVRRSSD